MCVLTLASGHGLEFRTVLPVNFALQNKSITAKGSMVIQIETLGTGVDLSHRWGTYRRGPGDGEYPSGVQGRSPVGGLGTKSPRS